MRWISKLRALSPRSRSLMTTCVYGLVAGAGAVGFHLAVHAAYEGGLMRLSRQSFPAFAAASLAIVLATSAAVGFLLSVYCPEAAGSGIPQLKLAYWRDMGVVSWRIAWVKFVAGLLSLGGGTSLGREGPSQPSDSSPSRCLLGKRVPSCPRWPPSRAPWECSSRSRAFP